VVLLLWAISSCLFPSAASATDDKEEIYKSLSKFVTPNAAFLPAYQSERDGAALKITHRVPYLGTLASENVIANATPKFADTDFILPLDVKLANTTNSMKFATALQVHVVASTLINYDIPYLNPNEYRSVSGGNLGWAKLENLSASYALVLIDECTPTAAERLSLKSVTPTIDPSPHGSELFHWGISFSDISKIWKNAIEAPRGERIYGCVVGYLEYNSDGKHYKRKFANTVQVSGAFVAGITARTAEYDLKLEAGQSGYSLELPIQNYIKPNCVDMFGIKFVSDRSAHFSIRLKLNFSDDTSVDLGEIELDYFRPKGSAADLQIVSLEQRTVSPPLSPLGCQ
jgi:hypothetical protein